MPEDSMKLGRLIDEAKAQCDSPDVALFLEWLLDYEKSQPYSYKDEILRQLEQFAEKKK